MAHSQVQYSLNHADVAASIYFIARVCAYLFESDDFYLRAVFIYIQIAAREAIRRGMNDQLTPLIRTPLLM